MTRKDFVKIINEEIKNFDFLGNDEVLKEQEVTDLLQNPDLQKQFICDSLLDKSGKVKIKEIVDSYIRGNWDESNTEDADRVTLVYSIDIDYRYDAMKEPITFNLYFNADKIDIGVDGWYNAGDYMNAPEGESWYNVFDWGDISVALNTIDGDDIEFKVFEQAPEKIQTLFMRHYLEGFIETESLELRTDDQKNTVHNTPYC